jgi:FkbM family methyltransferase
MRRREGALQALPCAKGILLELTPNKLLVSVKKRYYLGRLRRFGTRQEPDLRVVRGFVTSGDAVVDIGAHVGWYTRFLSQLVSGTGHVFSIEPVPETFEILSWCVQRLRLRNVTLLNCAVSDKSGSALMEVPRYSGGGRNFYQARIVDKKTEADAVTYEVPAHTLDELLGLRLRRRVSFIKCDVEGNELAVVRGASETIRGFRPVWLIEVSSDPDRRSSPAAQLFDLLGQSGYGAYWLQGHRLTRRSVGDRSVNYVFLTPEHVRKGWAKSVLGTSLPV